MNESLLHRVERLDKESFGDRGLAELLSALDHQIDSVRKEPTDVNVRKQIGDILFILVSLARNKEWELEELLEEAVVKMENRRAARHYYEAHVTINPVFGMDHEVFKKIAKAYKFHVATLLLQKRKEETPEKSKNDAFATGRSVSYSDMEDRMLGLVKALSAAGFLVHRYKIESTLLDSRHDDSAFPLELERIPEKERNPKAPADGALAGRV
jgi:hypothetical protein